MSYKCACGGPLVPCRVGIVENNVLQGTVCFKQWCPSCGNSRLTDRGEILYYNIKTDGEFTFDRMNFWVPETVPFQYKARFIDTVLKMAYDTRFEGKQYFTMEQIRNAYRGKK